MDKVIRKINAFRPVKKIEVTTEDHPIDYNHARVRVLTLSLGARVVDSNSFLRRLATGLEQMKKTRENPRVGSIVARIEARAVSKAQKTKVKKRLFHTLAQDERFLRVLNAETAEDIYLFFNPTNNNILHVHSSYFQNKNDVEKEAFAKKLRSVLAPGAQTA